jgi:hypothetical protein
MFLPPDQFDWPLNVMVARSGAQTVLIDAGLGAQFPAFPRAGQLPMRLEAAGIELAAVTDIVITHMHMDHVGGLLVEGVKESLRPDVRIHVAAAEVAFWAAPDFSHAVMPEAVPPVLRSTATQFLDTYRGQAAGLRGTSRGGAGRRRAPHRWPYAGAQRGRRRFGRSKVDLCRRCRVPGGFEHPEWQNGFEHDPEEAARVRVGLFRELAQNGGLLVAAHLPFPSLGRVSVEGQVFRWVPIMWDY